MKAKRTDLRGVTEVDGTAEEIAEFFRRVDGKPAPAPIPFISGFTIEGGCLHEWPEVWMSVSPPQCKKCGMPAPSYPMFTITAGSIGFLNAPSTTTTTLLNPAGAS